MAKLDPKNNPAANRSSTGAANQSQNDISAARAAAMSQARARSMARAQSIARAQAMKKAQADARLRALLAEDGVELETAEPEVVVEETATEAPAEEILAAEPTDQPAEETTEEVQSTEESVESDSDQPEEALGEGDEDDGTLKYAIEIHGLYKSYGKKNVLKGLDLEVYPGEMFGFIGRNGVGKSTTIDCMIGAKRFDDGEIVVGGHDIRLNPLDAKYSYGYVASEPTCYEVMTGYDYLEFVASIYGLTETEFTGNYRYLCHRLQLNVEELAHHISGYSHGMKQKLCLVASLLHNPNIWVLDEPTVGLDIMAQEELKKMMREYANHGKTVFVTSHNIEMVSAICDRVAIISDGVVKGIYDLNRDPQKRSELSRIFIETYGG